MADKELRSGIEAFRLGATAARVRKSLIGLSKTGPLAQLALPLVFSKFWLEINGWVLGLNSRIQSTPNVPKYLITRL